MGISDLQNIITAYQTKVASLQAAVTQKSQALDTAQSTYDTAIAQGNIDNISTLSAAVTTAQSDLTATKEALRKYSSTLPLAKADIKTVWESVYNDTLAPITTAKTALDTAKQAYIQAVNNYLSAGETAAETRRQYILLFGYAEHDSDYANGIPDSILKKLPGCINDVEYNYKKIQL